jgi:tetratricopeptide (TPR) repeat protein
MTKLASWLIAAGLAVTAAGQAYPQPGPNRFDYEVREDMFRGFFAGDKAAFARAMALSEARLAENPDHAQALVWHGIGRLIQAGEALRAGDRDKGVELNQQAVTEMARAVALRPCDVAVLIPRGAALLGAALRIQEVERARPYIEMAVGDFEKSMALQQRYLDRMPTHPKGELFAGLAEGWSRLGDAQKARFYLTRMVAELPDTPYSAAAKARLDDPSATSQITCLGCHTK